MLVGNCQAERALRLCVVHQFFCPLVPQHAADAHVPRGRREVERRVQPRVGDKRAHPCAEQRLDHLLLARRRRRAQ
eukprot:6334352-Prymnesium_polylepis.1